MSAIQQTHYTVRTSQSFSEFTTSLSEAEHFRFYFFLFLTQKLSKTQLLFCLCYGITYRLCLRLLDRVQTETNQTRDNKNRDKSEMRGSLHLRDFTLSAGEAKEGRRGAMLWDGDACNSRRAVARGDWVTLAKVMWEAWAEPGNEARAPETLNHKAILPTPRVFTLFLFLSFSDRKRIDWRAAVPQIPSIISHPGVLKPGNLLFIWIHPHVISLFLTGLFSGVVLKKKHNHHQWAFQSRDETMKMYMVQFPCLS